MRPFDKRLVFAVVLVLSLGVGLGLVDGVLAQAEDTHTALARELFSQGTESMRQQRWREAADRFEQVLELRPTANVRYNLASALAEMGEVTRAVELLHQVLEDPLAQPEARTAAEHQLGNVAARVAHIRIAIEDGAPPYEVQLDGEVVNFAVLGTDIAVDPTGHRVEVRIEEEIVFRRHLSLEEGERRVLQVRLPRSIPVEPSALVAGVEESSSVLESGWFWLAVGSVATIAVMAVVHATSMMSHHGPQPGNLGVLEISGGG